ncbi:3-deoxy-manno-octulosonate cytidylyltransferase 1 [Mycoavidus cysteinexigens]|uniref:3-deoxy-manno-octulosonate cytidylyltransferase n=1 Tax=Mycoavidus cysteinexigens TaxID=1553431 RepID=A0A2Z6ETD3_9BURK|nr:3-deoxy-manno-octulosonate cytidylyltransferase [Mycoavidus cysteinexigens]BBE08651.1 3-deoxy-manno-octulosonate cytidylyltransferase 1 [Mycoavidus cysteinexigens]GAM52643.1 3-deoxy-manno-octulosonate cytidylyltransferase [bacterium endosymbiont of Mortierella elongata FMR23-6]GLR01485.1 3-deoxy-manno-octulosonate cytidylyltransferase [Mycoavidus cysteinexigens]
MNNIRFDVAIPARLQSTRLPEKALAHIDDKPMVIHVAHRAQKSGAQRTIIATDSARIVECAKQYNIEVILTAESHVCGTDRLAELATKLDWADDQIIVNVQGDEPLIDPTLIQELAAHLAAHPSCALASAAHPISSPEEIFNPNTVKVVINAKGHALYFSRAPIPWARDAWPDVMGENGFSASKAAYVSELPVYRHIGIYAYRADFLRRFATLTPSPLEKVEALEQLRALWHGESIAIYVTDKAPIAGVDTAADLERVRTLFKQGLPFA